MRCVVLALAGALLAATTWAGEKGLATAPSRAAVSATMDRLETLVKSKGMTVFARIDHAAEARKVGLAMRPSQVLIFGNPKGGTPLMIASPTIAIDLPLKALAWEDKDGKVWLTYNSPGYLRNRHGVRDKEEAINALEKVLDDVTSKATQ